MKHENYLTRALELAKTRQGATGSNPAVGAVIVKDDLILAEGYHWGTGHPHAEIEAFAKLTPQQLEGATLYVTLEPCCHFGRTPPCVEAIAKHKIAAVYYGYQDPNPKVAGKGAQFLQNQAISCTHIPLAAITVFYKSYQHWWTTQKPFVIAKLAITLDAKIAHPAGQPATITSQDANNLTHRLRKRANAILTTAKTIIADNPQLNVRLPHQTIAKPIYIIDRHLSTPINAKIFTTAEKLTFFYQSSLPPEKLKPFQDQNAHCIPIEAHNHQLSLTTILTEIGKQGCHELFIEAGGHLFQSLITAHLVNQALIWIAPKLLGPQAIPAFPLKEDIFIAAKKVKWEIFDKDILCKIEYNSD